MHMRACVHACLRACVHACLCACVHACLCACMHACCVSGAGEHACLYMHACGCGRSVLLSEYPTISSVLYPRPIVLSGPVGLGRRSLVRGLNFEFPGLSAYPYSHVCICACAHAYTADDGMWTCVQECSIHGSSRRTTCTISLQTVFGARFFLLIFLYQPYSAQGSVHCHPTPYTQTRMLTHTRELHRATRPYTCCLCAQVLSCPHVSRNKLADFEQVLLLDAGVDDVVRLRRANFDACYIFIAPRELESLRARYAASSLPTVHPVVWWRVVGMCGAVRTRQHRSRQLWPMPNSSSKSSRPRASCKPSPLL